MTASTQSAVKLFVRYVAAIAVAGISWLVLGFLGFFLV